MHAKRSLALWGLVLVAVVALVLVGCSKPVVPPPSGITPSTPPPTVAPQGEPIKVGAIFSVSGTAGAPLGTPEKMTAQLVEEMINAKGGIQGRPLKLIIEDDKSDQTQAVTLAKKLIEQDKVVAVVGPTLSGPSLAIIDTFEKAQIPLISCAASVKITQPVKKWVFSTAQPDTLAVARLMEYMKAQKIKSIGVLYDSNPFGKSGMDVLKKQAPENDVKILAEEQFASADKDMTTQLTKIKGLKPDAVVCWGTNPGPSIVAKNMKQLGMTIPLLMSHGIANHKFIELAADAAEGITFPAGKLLVASALPDTEQQKATLLEYQKAFEAKFPDTKANTFGGHAWDALQILAKALESAGADDKAKLRDALEATTGFVGISGVFNLSATDHNGLKPDAFVMVSIKGGQWVEAK